LVTACRDGNSIKSDEEFATVEEAKAKFQTLYLRNGRGDFKKYFAALIEEQKKK
jgi:hypothetical protein